MRVRYPISKPNATQEKVTVSFLNLDSLPSAGLILSTFTNAIMENTVGAATNDKATKKICEWLKVKIEDRETFK